MYMQMVPLMRVIGKKISNMVEEWSSGVMELSMRETMSMGRKRDMVCLLGKMVANMKDSLLIIISMGKEYTYGLTRGSLMENGSSIRCGAMVYLRGLITGSTKESIMMIKSMEKEPLLGQMAEFIKVVGWMGNSMAMESI